MRSEDEIKKKIECICENCIHSYEDEMVFEDVYGDTDYRLKLFCSLHLLMDAKKCKEYALEDNQ